MELEHHDNEGAEEIEGICRLEDPVLVTEHNSSYWPAVVCRRSGKNRIMEVAFAPVTKFYGHRKVRRKSDIIPFNENNVLMSRGDLYKEEDFELYDEGCKELLD